LGAFYGGGELFKDSRLKAVALDGASASIIASGLILQPLKYGIGRSRPGARAGAYDFHPLSGRDSFPSGHTTEAFVLASVIAEHYDSIWIKAASYTVASAVGWARLNNNDHWASDVLAGAALGTFVGEVVVHYNLSQRKVSLAPLAGPGFQGAQLTLSF
jgi:membrane-associated phospholipid phosphatase